MRPPPQPPLRAARLTALPRHLRHTWDHEWLVVDKGNATVGITVNRNAVPNDPRPPMVTSGLRIGTPALATRGFTAEDFAQVAGVIAEALKPSYDAEALKTRVESFADKHPLYAGL